MTREIKERVAFKKVDVDALNQQVEEKKQRLAAEKARDLDTSNLLLYYDAQVCHKQSAVEDSRRQAARDLVSWRKTNQGGADESTSASEDKPETFGLSSLQHFEGEHNDFKNDAKIKIAQNNEAWSAQIEQKRLMQEKETADKNLTAKVLANQEAIQSNIQFANNESRKQSNISVSQENKRLAEEKKLREANSISTIQQQNEQEQAYVTNSVFMKENSTESALGAHRFRADHYKSMKASDLQDIRNIQEQQRQAAKEKRAQEEYNDLVFARESYLINRTVLEQQRQVDNFRAEQAIAAASQLQKAHADKIAKEKAVAETENKDQMTDKFFSQFGNSYR